jgi:hypothetical protein
MGTSNIWPPIVAWNNFTHENCPGDAWNGCGTILKMITKMASFDSFDNWMHYTTLIMENVPTLDPTLDPTTNPNF